MLEKPVLSRLLGPVDTPWVAARWIPAVEIARGIAALAVVVHHIYEQVYGLDGGWLVGNMLGAWGVTLFFVISGFCIHLPQARRFAAGPAVNPDWRVFARQRLWRIYPAYLAALVASACVGAFVPTNLLTTPTARGVISHALFVHSFTGDTRTINGVFWSIAVEMHFYLIYPLYLWLRRRAGAAGTVLIGLIIGVSYTYAAGMLTPVHSEYRWDHSVVFIALWWQWCLGAWLAETYVARQVPRPLLSLTQFPGATPVWAVLSVLLVYVKLTFFRVVVEDTTLFRIRVGNWLLPFFCLLLLTSAITRVHRLPQWLDRSLQAVGLRSYSLYLIHPVAIAAMLPLVDGWPLKARELTMGAASLLFTWVLFGLVERHSLRVSKPVAGRGAGPTGLVPASVAPDGSAAAQPRPFDGA